MDATCIAAWALALLLLPFIVLLWATESRRERCRRLQRKGMSQREIAAHLNLTRYQVRKALS